MTAEKMTGAAKKCFQLKKVMPTKQIANVHVSKVIRPNMSYGTLPSCRAKTAANKPQYVRLNPWK